MYCFPSGSAQPPGTANGGEMAYSAPPVHGIGITEQFILTGVYYSPVTGHFPEIPSKQRDTETGNFNINPLDLIIDVVVNSLTATTSSAICANIHEITRGR
jgi:hypothetical protein